MLTRRLRSVLGAAALVVAVYGCGDVDDDGTGGPSSSSGDSTAGDGDPTGSDGGTTSGDSGTPGDDGATTSNDGTTTGDDGTADTGGTGGGDAYGECGTGCPDGQDCLNPGAATTGTYCSPRCTEDSDCPAGGDGSAIPVCLVIVGDGWDATNCALYCDDAGNGRANCPTGMECESINADPDGLCTWLP